MMICPNCDDERGGNFCSDCGGKLMTNRKARYCRSCGIELDPSKRFCFYCGWDQMKIKPAGFFRRLWDKIAFSILH